MYLNKVILIGNLTRDPELKALPSGTKVCNFSIATNRVFKDKEGQRQESVEYHNIVAFARTGELVAQYMRKGYQVMIEGRMQTRSWDANDGQKKYRTEVIAESVQFGSRPGGAGSGPKAGSKEGETPSSTGEKIDYPTEEINPDDIPF